MSVRPEPPVFRLLPHRAGFRLAKKLVVFDVAPANRDLVELVPLPPVGVDRPELPSDVAANIGNRLKIQHSPLFNLHISLHCMMHLLHFSRYDPVPSTVIRTKSKLTFNLFFTNLTYSLTCTPPPPFSLCYFHFPRAIPSTQVSQHFRYHTHIFTYKNQPYKSLCFYHTFLWLSLESVQLSMNCGCAI